MVGEHSPSDMVFSPRGSISGPSGGHRKERGAIAAQACENCRSRKQKCDEQRPKCTTCRKLQLECHYREPQPTKKDKTLVEILERLKSIEGKFDNLSLQQTNFTPTIYAPFDPTPIVHPAASLPHNGLSPIPGASLHASDDGTISGTGQPYVYTSSVHHMLGWPAVRELLESVSVSMPKVDVASIKHEGAGIVLGINRPINRLPSDPVGPVTTIDPTTTLNNPATAQFRGTPLTSASMQMLSNAYFDTFNHCYPILDRQKFLTEILGPLFRDGITDTMQTTLAFMVFALGEVAVAGSQGAPVEVFNARPSGIKGGTKIQPPGLALYNEARRQMGFSLAECSLEAVQTFALAGMYCEACASHLEFWRLTTTASLACQALITGKPAELTSPQADLVRRCFWYCCMTESQLFLELELPRSGLENLADVVGPPVFAGYYTQEDFMGTHASLSQENFTSNIALRQLTMEINAVLSNGSFAGHYTDSLDAEAFPATVKQLAFQLEQWRATLPLQLRWRESQPGEFPNPSLHTTTGQMGSTSPSEPSSAMPGPPPAIISSPSGFMFTTDLDAAPTSYPYNLDVQMAVLRSRYYHAKLLLYRPFLHKALARPEQMTRDDAAGAAAGLRACLKWPVSMSPTCARKRLVPCLWFWTQNMLGVLLLLRFSERAPVLRRIRAALCGESFELEAGETVGLYMDWIRDLRCVDGAAGWAWDVVRAVYGLEE